MVSLVITTSILLFCGLEDVREGTIATMPLIDPTTRAMSTAIHTEKRYEHTSKDEWGGLTPQVWMFQRSLPESQACPTFLPTA